MKNLWYVSILCLLVGCSFSHYGKYKREQNIKSSELKLDYQLPFTDQAVLYKAQMDFFKKHFSGLFLFKTLKDGGRRVVFVTETGLTIFDFELTATGNFIVHHCLEVLKDKKIVKLLEADMRMILMDDLKNATWEQLRSLEEGVTVYKYQENKERRFYFINSQTKVPEKMESASKLFVNTSIALTGYEAGIPSLISIKHKRIGLKMELRKLKR